MLAKSDETMRAARAAAYFVAPACRARVKLVDPGSGFRDPGRAGQHVDQPRPGPSRRHTPPHPPALIPDVGQVRFRLHQPRIESALQQVLAHRLRAIGHKVANGLCAPGQRSAEGNLRIPARHEAGERVAKEVLDDEYRHRGDHGGQRSLEQGEPLDDGMHRGFVDARQHRGERPIMDLESCALSVQQDGGGNIRCGPVSPRNGGDLASARVRRRGLKELGTRPAGQHMVDVACKGVQERSGQVVGQGARVEWAASPFGRVPPGPPQRRQQGDSLAPEGLCFRRGQVAHLHVVAEHGAM